MAYVQTHAGRGLFLRWNQALEKSLISLTPDGEGTIIGCFSCRWRHKVGIRQGQDRDESEGELLDPHFLILAQSHECGNIARKVAAAMTAFINRNVARAIGAGVVKPLANVEK